MSRTCGPGGNVATIDEPGPDKQVPPVRSSDDAALAQRSRQSVAGALEGLEAAIEDFHDSSQEWRRLFCRTAGHLLPGPRRRGRRDDGPGFPEHHQPRRGGSCAGTDGHGDHPVHGQGLGRPPQPRGSIAFALRRDFPVAASTGYVVVQLVGARVAVLVPAGGRTRLGRVRLELPRSSFASGDAFLMEWCYPGPGQVILGTASGAQNVGVFGALGVGGYIALAGLWGSPISGASMNPSSNLRPRPVGANFTSYWVYVAGPLAGAVLAVGIAYILRGRGGGWSGSKRRGRRIGYRGPAARPGLSPSRSRSCAS